MAYSYAKTSGQMAKPKTPMPVLKTINPCVGGSNKWGFDKKYSSNAAASARGGK